MPEQPSQPGPEPTSSDGANRYVIEHYGFAASSEVRVGDQRGTAARAAPPTSSDPVRSSARPSRRRKMLAAGVLGLALAGGIGGIGGFGTAATAHTGPGPHGGGNSGGVFTVDAAHGAGRPADADGPEGGR